MKQQQTEENIDKGMSEEDFLRELIRYPKVRERNSVIEFEMEEVRRNVEQDPETAFYDELTGVLKMNRIRDTDGVLKRFKEEHERFICSITSDDAVSLMEKLTSK